MDHVRIADGTSAPVHLASAEHRLRREQVLVLLRVARVVLDRRMLHEVDVLATVLIVVLRVGWITAQVRVHNPQHALRGTSGHMYKVTCFVLGEGRSEEGGHAELGPPRLARASHCILEEKLVQFREHCGRQADGRQTWGGARGIAHTRRGSCYSRRSRLAVAVLAALADARSKAPQDVETA